MKKRFKIPACAGSDSYRMQEEVTNIWGRLSAEKAFPQ
jgi:hypothetical protein